MRRNAEEFERVALVHTPVLLRFAVRLTRDRFSAEDLVQETLLLAWRGFGQFAEGTNARAWLFRILMNCIRGQHRKTRAAAPVVVLTPDVRATSASIDDSVEVLQALDRLGADHREALLLAVVEGFTCREMSEILSVPMGTVMSRLSRAREAMREALAPRGGRCGERVAR